MGVYLNYYTPGVVLHTCNPSKQEAEAAWIIYRNPPLKVKSNQTSNCCNSPDANMVIGRTLVLL